MALLSLHCGDGHIATSAKVVTGESRDQGIMTPTENKVVTQRRVIQVRRELKKASPGFPRQPEETSLAERVGVEPAIGRNYRCPFYVCVIYFIYAYARISH